MRLSTKRWQQCAKRSSEICPKRESAPRPCLVFLRVTPPDMARPWPWPSPGIGPACKPLPTIWQRFAAFETFAENAQRMAAALETSEDGEPLRAASVQLRSACDACHAGFMKPYTPPVVTDEDRNFDFDSVLPPQ